MDILNHDVVPGLGEHWGAVIVGSTIIGNHSDTTKCIFKLSGVADDETPLMTQGIGT